MQQSKLGKIGKMNAQKEDIAENFIDSTNTLIFDDRQILLSFLIDNDIEYIKIFTRFTDKYIEDMKLGIFNRKEAIQIIKIDIVDEVNSQWIADSGIAFDKGFTELQRWNVAKHLVTRFEANYHMGRKKEFDIFNKADMERMMDEACEEALAEEENNPTVEAVVYKLPKCNFCDSDAEYDATMIMGGEWANFCETHFETHSTGELGLGLGQKLIEEKEEN